MIIAAAAAGADPKLTVDSRFGRAPLFLVYDTEKERCTLIENTLQLESAQGAGIQSVQHSAESGADVLICRHCGAKAYREGNWEVLEEADVEGHWI